MKNEKRMALYATTILLSCISAMFSLSSCSDQSGKVETQPIQTATPTPVEAKMEGQSENWKVIVVSIEKVAKKPLIHDPVMDPVRVKERPENKYDTLQVRVNVEYIGAAGNVQSPAFGLVDVKGQKFDGLEATLGGDMPAPDDPEFDKKVRVSGEILSWATPANNPDYKKKPRALKGGEKFPFILSFQDPKEYANLKFVFNDVPPITLKPPQDERGAK